MLFLHIFITLSPFFFLFVSSSSHHLSWHLLFNLFLPLFSPPPNSFLLIYVFFFSLQGFTLLLSFINQILTLFFMTSLLYLLTFSLCFIFFFHLLIHNSIIYLCMCFSFIFFGCYCCRNDFARYLGNVS